MFTVDVCVDQIDKADDRIQQAKRLCWIASAHGNNSGQVFLRFRKSQFWDKEEYAVGVGLKDSADTNAQYRANQDVGSGHECSI